jgi:lysophospholipase L1-like esterase
MMKHIRQLALLALSTISFDPASQAQSAAPEMRVAAWAPSMTVGGQSFNDNTMRMVVHPSVGGDQLRLRFSNLRGLTPLEIGEVGIAMQAREANAVPGSMHKVTVDHASRFTIAPGKEVLSDPVPMKVGAEQNLLVSLYLPKPSGSTSWHSDAFENTYVSPPNSGNHVNDAAATSFTGSTTSWYVLSGLDVMSGAAGTVVAFGDSITDGYDTPRGANARWPDALARRLADARHPIGVVDAGIGGNRVLTTSPSKSQGISAVKRFGHDALALPNVRTVIVMEGINDIGNNAGVEGHALTAQQLIDGYRELIRQAHGKGIRIIGGTMLPFKGAGYYTAYGESIREACNHWILTSGSFDGVIDFDTAMRDSDDPQKLRPSYDSGDHLHPNVAGMQAMANAVNLRLLVP